MDAADPARLGAFWAGVLNLTWKLNEDGEGLLSGPTPQHTIWINRVPESSPSSTGSTSTSTRETWRTSRRSARL